MRILYIFPHPDDESFGPAAAMASQLRAGHEVGLLTLTKGGATKVRHDLGLSVEEMGEVRYKEMLDVKDSLGLTSMDVWDYPDSGLQEMDPRELETAIKEYIIDWQPNIIVTYPVHGISGFHDHLVAHAVIKRLYLELKDAGADYLKRLAFFTLKDNGLPVWIKDVGMRIKQSPEYLIDVELAIGTDEKEMLKKCLSCYKTYQDTIDESGIIEKIGDSVFFEIYGEDFSPVLGRLEEGVQV